MRPREGGQAEGARVAGTPVGGCRQAASHAGATLAFRAATKPARASFLDAPCRAGPASMTGSDTCPRRICAPDGAGVAPGVPFAAEKPQTA